ncbi:hypothetical protein FJW06_28190 [Mesorhizobium sp. B4-1-3]|nr:hypothetical protein FJW06_28190 [Mesorhizobium sp. B4-1-3]
MTESRSVIGLGAVPVSGCASIAESPPPRNATISSVIPIIGYVGGTAPPSVLPDISPTSGEIGYQARFRHPSALAGHLRPTSPARACSWRCRP